MSQSRYRLDRSDHDGVPKIDLQDVALSVSAWMIDSACRGRPGFTERPKDDRTRADLRAVCAVCPVLATCEAFAATYNVEGFYAGTWHAWAPVPLSAAQRALRDQERADALATRQHAREQAARHRAERAALAESKRQHTAQLRAAQQRAKDAAYRNRLRDREHAQKLAREATAARALAEREARAAERVRAVEAAHGTRAGWARHRHRGETPCPPCLEADRAYKRAARQRAKQAA